MIKGDPLWRQERPRTLKVYEDYRRLIATVDDSSASAHPVLWEIIYKFTVRLHCYIHVRDAGHVPPDQLVQEMSELRSYIIPERSSETFEAAAEKFRGMLYRAGCEVVPKIKKRLGPPINTRHLYVSAYEMQLRRMTYREITDAMCPCPASPHRDDCCERFRKGIQSVRAMLGRMNHPPRN